MMAGFTLISREVGMVLAMSMSLHRRYQEILDFNTGRVISRVGMVEVDMGQVNNRNRSKRRSRVY
jgi:hypothetical protein